VSAVLHIDSGVMCNHKGCYDMIYASQLNLADRASAAVVRAELRERGWQTRRVPDESGRKAYRTEDYCPVHAEDASSGPAIPGGTAE
jgi:hypothetical protein